MTIGITICLADGALLIADGKKTKPFAANDQVESDINKIHRITQTVSAISLGINLVTDKALKIIRKDFVGNTKLAPEDVINIIERSLDECWSSLLQSLSPDIDPNDPSLRAGFLVGGIASNTSFIGGILFCPNRQPFDRVETQPLKYIVLGGEKQNSADIFKGYFDQIAGKLQKRTSCEETHLPVLISAGVCTIREVEKTNPTIGGTIRYAIIRRDCPYCEVVVK